MKDKRWLIGVIGIMLVLGACEHTQDKESIEQKEVQNQESIVVTNEPDQVAFDESGVPPIFQEFFNQSKLLEDHNLTFFETADLDSDGIDEAVFSLGDFERIGILKNENGTIKMLDDFAGRGYEIYEIKLVHLEDRAEKVVYLGLTNGANLSGFQLLTLRNQQPETLCYSASATGAGNDVLEDFNQNGKYDGYTQHRWSYDVFDYQVDRTFQLKEGYFQLQSTTVSIPEYPATAHEVVGQFMTLSALSAGNSPEVQERLSTLCPTCKHNEYYLSEFWTEGLHQYYFGFISDWILESKEDKAAASLELSMPGQEQNKKVESKIVFRLVNQNQKWMIEEITEHPNPYSFLLFNKPAALLERIDELMPKGKSLAGIVASDLDGDGKYEYIASFSEGKDMLDEMDVYILQQIGERYVSLGMIEGSFGWIYEIDVIKLDNSRKSYVYASRTNGFSGGGYDLSTVNGHKLVQVSGGFSPTGSGGGPYLAKQEDGTYFRVYSQRFTDYQGHELIAESHWTGKNFESYEESKSYIIYSDFYLSSRQFVYPETPEGVVETYLAARYLNTIEDVNHTTAQELDQICINEEVKQFDLSNIDLSSLMYYALTPKLERIVDKNDSITMEVSDLYSQENNGDNQTLTVVLNLVEKKWKIEKVFWKS